VIDFDTPTERLLGASPNYEALCVFGCAYWPNLRPYNKRKLSFRSTCCVFLGYSSHHKGVKCLDTSTGRVYISRDVVFDEYVFPFASLNPNSGKRLQKEILLLPIDTPSTLGDANIDDYMPLPVVPNVHPVVSKIVARDDQVDAANNTCASTEEIEADGENLANTDARRGVHEDVHADMHGTGAYPDLDSDSAASSRASDGATSSLSSPGRSRSASPTLGVRICPMHPFPAPRAVSLARYVYTRCRRRSVSLPPASSPPTSPLSDEVDGGDSPGGTDRENDDDSMSLPSPVAEVAEPQTRLQKGIRHPKQYTDGTIRYGMFTSTCEPNTLVKAFEDTRWIRAMQDEYDALMDNKTWHLSEFHL
jgi:hypothetical protein